MHKDSLVTADIGFVVCKTMTVPGAEEGDEDKSSYLPLPWKGMLPKPAPTSWNKNPSALYKAGSKVKGLWGPSLQSTDIVVAWDNTHAKWITKSVDYKISLFSETSLPEDSEPIITKENLASFYAKHDPSKVEEVDNFLADYSPSILLKHLIGKYEESPIELKLSASDLEDFYQRHDPAKIKDIKKNMEEFDIPTIVMTLIDKYGVCPPLTGREREGDASGEADKEADEESPAAEDGEDAKKEEVKAEDATDNVAEEASDQDEVPKEEPMQSNKIVSKPMEDEDEDEPVNYKNNDEVSSTTIALREQGTQCFVLYL